MARLTDCPPEVLVEICRQLVLPMQNERSGYQHPHVQPETANALACRTALARLMRTCRKLHDAAGCMLYSGYYHIWHPSEAHVFLKTLDHESHQYRDSYFLPEDSRIELVRHADLHTNLYRDRLVDVEWSVKQEDLTEEPWINRIAGNLGIYFRDGWNMDPSKDLRWDRVMEHVNQFCIRYLPNLTTLDVILWNRWEFTLLQAWAEKQQVGFAGLLPNLRHLRIHLLALEARNYNCHKIILEAAPNLSTLEIHDSFSYTIPAGCKLLNLRSLKFVDCSMDRNSMKNILLATPNITHLEYQSISSDKLTPEPPILNPQMLCNLLRNEYDLADPQTEHAVTRSRLELPSLHRQLRTLIIDFHSTDDFYRWEDSENARTLRDFVELRHLSIDVHSFTYIADSNHLVLGNLTSIIPETLESLEVTRIGEDCFDEVVGASLRDIAEMRKKGRFQWLMRISLMHCELEWRHQKSLNDLKLMFDRPGAPLICVEGRIQRVQKMVD